MLKRCLKLKVLLYLNNADVIHQYYPHFIDNTESKVKNLLKTIQYDLLDFIEGEDEPDYTPEDVTACITSLLEFMSSIESEEQTVDSAKQHIKTLVLSLNTLNESCDDCLIDTNQGEDICQFIEKVVSATNIDISSDVTKEWRMW